MTHRMDEPAADVAGAICRYVAAQPDDHQKLPAIQFINNRSDEIAFAAITALRQQERQEGEGRAPTPSSERLAAADPVGATSEMPGSNGGFSMAVFKAIDVPIGAPLYTSDAIQAAVAAEREACAECQPSTAEDPNENAYQRGKFDGIMEFINAIRARPAIEGIDALARVREG